MNWCAPDPLHAGALVYQEFDTEPTSIKDSYLLSTSPTKVKHRKTFLHQLTRSFVTISEFITLYNYCVPLAINLCCLKCLLLRLKNCHCTHRPDNTIKSIFRFFFNIVKPMKASMGEHKTTLGTGTVLLPSFSILIGRSSFSFSLSRYRNVDIQ